VDLASLAVHPVYRPQLVDLRAIAFGGLNDWPSPTYREDPVRFARQVLGIEPTDKQREILEAIRDHKRVTVRSGHKCGKSMTAAIAALWFYCSFDDARVVMSSTTARQVDAILWREVKKLHARAAKRGRPIDGTPHELARSGLKSGFREIVGFTAREAEAVAGVSGANLLYLIDEASGVPDAIYEAIEGNRAGGARIALFSNPTQTVGEFYRSHRDPKTSKFYHAIHVSSEDSPNVKAGRIVIPALAEREWVEQKREEWGETHPLYLIRVRGEFVIGEDGKILTVHAIEESQKRWYDTPAAGRLQLGLDPAGPGEGGDESAFALRRGLKIIALTAMRGKTEDALVRHVVGELAPYRQERDEVPLVKVDADGPIGSRVYGLLRAYQDAHPRAFEVVRVRSSDRAQRAPRSYDRMRDELWANLAAWVGEGGAIPEDDKLSQELHAPEWIGQLTGRLKVTSKQDIRKALGRSPDRADAVALACWEPMTEAPDAEPAGPTHEPEPQETAIDRVFDPYAGV
jgi:phage terminase large subunit